MNTYMSDLSKSYSAKRELYSEFQMQQSLRGFDYTKDMYVREKFPKFPKRMRIRITEIM